MLVRSLNFHAMKAIHPIFLPWNKSFIYTRLYLLLYATSFQEIRSSELLYSLLQTIVDLIGPRYKGCANISVHNLRQLQSILVTFKQMESARKKLQKRRIKVTGKDEKEKWRITTSQITSVHSNVKSMETTKKGSRSTRNQKCLRTLSTVIGSQLWERWSLKSELASSEYRTRWG